MYPRLVLRFIVQHFFINCHLEAELYTTIDTITKLTKLNIKTIFFFNCCNKNIKTHSFGKITVLLIQLHIFCDMFYNVFVIC